MDGALGVIETLGVIDLRLTQKERKNEPCERLSVTYDDSKNTEKMKVGRKGQEAIRGGDGKDMDAGTHHSNQI